MFDEETSEFCRSRSTGEVGNCLLELIDNVVLLDKLELEFVSEGWIKEPRVVLEDDCMWDGKEAYRENKGRKGISIQNRYQGVEMK